MTKCWRGKKRIILKWVQMEPYNLESHKYEKFHQVSQKTALLVSFKHPQINFVKLDAQ